MYLNLTLQRYKKEMKLYYFGFKFIEKLYLFYTTFPLVG